MLHVVAGVLEECVDLKHIWSFLKHIWICLLKLTAVMGPSRRMK